MVYPGLLTVSSMKPDDIFEELRTRLYELGDARSHALPNSALEPHQLSLHRGLRTADITVELLRYKFQDIKASSRDAWKARRDDLLEALRMPWNQCARNSSGGPKCPGGSVNCDFCRYSILSITSQLNTLALGFAGTPLLEKDESYGLQDKEKDHDAARAADKDKVASNSIEQELSSVKTTLSEAQKTIKGLTKDLASTKDMLATSQKTVKQITTDRKNDEKSWGKLNKAYGSMTEKVKECVGLLNSSVDLSATEMVWQVVIKQCEALNEMVSFQLTDGLAMEKLPKDDDDTRRKILNLETLRYQHQQIRALIEVKEYSKAEKVAKNVLDQRRQYLDQDATGNLTLSQDYCDSFEKYCTILEGAGTAEAAEFEYMQIWYGHGPKINGFQDKAGVSLAQLKQRQNEVEEAAFWYRKVARLRLTKLDLNAAADVALKMISVQKSIQLSLSSAKVLEDIWSRSRQQTKPEVQQTTAVLNCGLELGKYYMSVREHSKAKAVLAAAWREWNDKDLDSKMRVALLLALIDPQLVDDGNDGDFKDLYKWISEHANAPLTELVSLENRYQLGSMQLAIHDRKGAEKTLKAAWEQAKGTQGHGPSGLLTIDIGCGYGQTISADAGREAEAMAVFAELWTALESVHKVKSRAAVKTKTKTKTKTAAATVAQVGAVLRTARAYAELLVDAAEACTPEEEESSQYGAAKAAHAVLNSAWDVAWPQRERLMADAEGDRSLSVLEDLLWIGDAHGGWLTYLDSPGLAAEVLERVLEIKNTRNPSAAEIELTLGLQKVAQDAEAERKQKLEKPAPAPGGASKSKSPVLPLKPTPPKSKPPKPRKQHVRMSILRYCAGAKN